MYIRFVITQIDMDSHQSQGLFIAAQTLLASGDLSMEERKTLQEELVWFNQNLPSPDKPYIRGRVIFWFRSSAKECIQRMWNVANILRVQGHLVEVQKCVRLYNVVYHDEWQVAAFPHKHDGRRTFK
jgi:hypothetical protein